MKKLIVTNAFSIDYKSNLLNIKLYFISNSEYANKRRFVIISIILVNPHLIQM